MPQNIALQRLKTQGLIDQPFKTPTEVVAWLGGVQAQDYSGAKWALGQRIKGADDALVEQAMTDGAIIRTHVLRPTWHFVAAADLRWMLALTAPRIHALNAYYYRKMELDESVFAQSHKMLAKALEGEKHLMRSEIVALYKQVGIIASELRLGYLLMHAEVEGLICSGPRKGKQFTYALMDERVPASKSLRPDDALAELTRRYFTGHGPATIQDFMWWSSLSLADATAGLESVKTELQHEVIKGETFWWGSDSKPETISSPVVHLLPNYDEVLGSYHGQSATIDPQYASMWDGKTAVFPHFLMIDGHVLGTWKRDLKKTTVSVTVKPFRDMTEAETQGVERAAERFGTFLGLRSEVTMEM